MEYIVEICVAIDIAILGIAYPITVDKVSNIGEKYASYNISTIFDTEFPQRQFVWQIGNKEYRTGSIFLLTLVFTVISFLPLIINAKPWFGWNNWWVNHSAKLIVLILSVLLTLQFIIWLNKVSLYNGNTGKLLQHLIKRYNKLNREDKWRTTYLKAINEITFYAVQHQDEQLQKTLIEFYTKEFSSIRRTSAKAEALVYPIDLYDFLYKLVGELTYNENRKLLAIEHRAVSGVWLFGEGFEDVILSEQTYAWIWHILNTTAGNSRYVEMYWSNANNYFDSQIPKIAPDMDYATGILRNYEAIIARDDQRKRYLEFHYALGGLLLYRKNYDAITILFEYTESFPPNYPLLPENMTEIFYWINYFADDFSFKRGPIDTIYPFAELNNMGSASRISYWMWSFLALLFVRQFSLQAYYVFQKPTDLPQLPAGIIELEKWKGHLPIFKRFLKEALENHALLEKTNLSVIVAEKHIEIEGFLDRLLTEIQEKMGAVARNTPLSLEKIDKFEKTSNQIIVKALNNYLNVFQSITNTDTKDGLSLTINGARILAPRSGFTDHDIPTMEFDSFFASLIANDNLNRAIPNSFLVAKTDQYVLNYQNILQGIEKAIGTVRDTCIVIINASSKLMALLNNSSYANQLLFIPSTQHDTQDFVYILRKKDLPTIEYLTPSEDEKEKFALKEINSSLQIFASILDMHSAEHGKLRKSEAPELKDDGELKVLLVIAFLWIIRWKQEREIIQISLISPFHERGLENQVNEVIPLNSAQDIEDFQKKNSS